MKNKATLSTFSLVLLITGAIDSIRNLPAAAWFGSQLIFFFVLSAIIFLIPVALVSAELATIWPEEENGIYGWVKKAFGRSWAFITIWLQWVNTLVWYPTILLFITSTLNFLFFQDSASSKLFSTVGSIIIFWSMTFLALRGVHTSAKLASICAIIGMILPMFLIIVLGLIWLFLTHNSSISFHLGALMPDITHQSSWISLTAIMTAFLGMELAAVHVRQIKHPQRTYPKAMLYSIILILITMVMGSLAIAIVLPRQEINLVVGVLQTCLSFMQKYHLELVMPCLVLLIFIGSIGSMVNWIIAPTQGLAQAAQDKFLPSWFATKNSYGVPAKIIIAQAIIVTMFCLSFQLMPNINSMYWFFTDLSTELYMCMYVLMFLAAIKIKRKYATLTRPFSIPGQKFGYYLTCLLGLIGCIITLYIGFFPPQEALSLPHPELYKLYFLGGLIIMLVPALLRLAGKKLIAQVGK